MYRLKNYTEFQRILEYKQYLKKESYRTLYVKSDYFGYDDHLRNYYKFYHEKNGSKIFRALAISRNQRIHI